MIKSKIITITISLFFIFNGCYNENSDNTSNEGINNNILENCEQPVYSISFNKNPTQEEIEEAYQNYINVNPSSYLKAGEKRITIIAKTCNLKSAGSDTLGIFFIGTWEGNNNFFITKYFLLGDKNKRHFVRDQIDVLFFILDLKTSIPNITEDKFSGGQIMNISEDAWCCEYLQIQELNYRGELRSNILNFFEWIDTNEFNPFSKILPAVIKNWLSYY